MECSKCYDIQINERAEHFPGAVLADDSRQADANWFRAADSNLCKEFFNFGSIRWPIRAVERYKAMAADGIMAALRKEMKYCDGCWP